MNGKNTEINFRKNIIGLQKVETDFKNIIINLYHTNDDISQCIDSIILDKLILEFPPEKLTDSYDISTNIALILTKVVKKPPIKIAEDIVLEIQKLDYISAVEIAKPAFINLKLNDNILLEMAVDIVTNGDTNVVKNLGNNEKINVEFCSANPTGPLHIGHARGTIFGDVLASMLEKSGYSVCREYYVNDAGGQMDKLEKSINWRLMGSKGELPKDCYPGEYLQEIADKQKTYIVIQAIIELTKKKNENKNSDKDSIDNKLQLLSYKEVSDYVQKEIFGLQTNDTGKDYIIHWHSELPDILHNVCRIAYDNNIISPAVIVCNKDGIIGEGFFKKNAELNGKEYDKNNLQKDQEKCINSIINGEYDFLLQSSFIATEKIEEDQKKAVNEETEEKRWKENEGNYYYSSMTNSSTTIATEQEIKITAEKKKKNNSSITTTSAERKIRIAKEMISTFIKPTLDKIKIKYDIFSSEQDLKNKNTIENSIKHLRAMGLIYNGVLEPPKGQKIEDWEPREQMLFKATQFGDDVDRPLAKSDGSHTYFASDIAYHYDKFKRGFNKMIDVLGADHKGYVKRLTSAVKAISSNQAEIHIKLCELVNFVKNGEMVKMSKRKNNFLTIDDVINEIEPDILRFIILTRKADTVLNFDLALAKDQSKDNPIWYIQYAHSRCCSVLNNAIEQGIISSNNNFVNNFFACEKCNNCSNDFINAKKCNKNSNDSNVMQQQYDNNHNTICDIIKTATLPRPFHKLLVQVCFYTRFLELAVKNYEPYFFTNYLIQLANEFHSVWSAGIKNANLRFIQQDNSNNNDDSNKCNKAKLNDNIIGNNDVIVNNKNAKNMLNLLIIKCVKTIIKNGLDMFKIEALERM